jgi:tetratricopeptide (TPR) repeat protein
MNKIGLISVILFISVSLKSQSLSYALEAYENFQYDLALKEFKKVWRKKKDDIKINYLYGKCILRSDIDRTKAIPLLETVLGNDINYEDISFEMGKAYMYDFKFDNSKQLLEYFLKNYNFEDDNIGLEKKKEAKLLLKQIESAKGLISQPLNVNFLHLSENVNTKRSEFSPFISKDGQRLFFTSNKRYDSDLLELIKDGYYSDFTPNETQKWTKLKSMGKNVNSTEHEMIVGTSQNQEKIVMSVTWSDSKGDLCITNKNKASFDELLELEKTVNSEFDETSGCISNNEDTLFFSSNRPGGYGGYDLYISIKLPNDTWGKPINLGPSINTEYNEEFPAIENNGATLYFASNRPESMGGYDIFTSQKVNSSWTEIKNFGYPVNDFYDNYSISFTKNKRYAYVSTIRDENTGGLDIYQVIFNDVPAPNVIYTGTIKKGTSENSSIIETPIIIEAYEEKSNKLFATSQYSSSGKYTFAFPPGNFKIKVSGEGFNTYEKIIRIPENEILNTFVKYNILVN